MEDYPQPPNDNEYIPPEKRRYLRGNFLLSWLHRKREKSEKTNINAEDEDEDKKKKKNNKLKSRENTDNNTSAERKKYWLPDMIRDKLRALFISVVGVEPVTLPNNTIYKSPDYADVGNNLGDSVLEYSPGETANAEPMTGQEQYGNDGLLPVSEEAVTRYRLETGSEQLEEGDEENDNSLTASTDGRIEGRSEPLVAQERGKTVETKRGPETREGAVPMSEILRRKRDKRLKLEFKQLKEQATSVSQEQEQIKKQQERFSRELDAQEKRNVRTASESHFANIEPDQIALKPQPTAEYILPRQQHEAANIAAPEKTVNTLRTETSDILPEIPTDKLKELVVAQPSQNPETILHKVEEAAERNAPIESLYERRHEVKDEHELVGSSNSIGRFTNGQLAKSKLRHGYLRQPPLISAISPAKLAENDANKQPNIYKQAIHGGFWAGIVLCILLFLMLIVYKG